VTGPGGLEADTLGRARPETPNYRKLREHFEEHGQAHVFAFWDQLAEPAREALLRQIATMDLPVLLAAYAAGRDHPEREAPKLEPLEVERLPDQGGDPGAWEAAAAAGEALLREGRVAALVVAGGQATRLGYDAPKGLFPLGPVTGRSLFEIQAQKLRRLRDRCGRPVPWYVMTSPATDAATREFFAGAGCFGLPEEDVFFFSQGTVPSFDFEGRLILAAPDRVFENPNGHGGSLTALLDSGALDDMERRGIDTLFYYQVDNPLVRMADPAFLGFHTTRRAEVSCKVIRKRDPEEKVGVLARADGRPAVVEYTEIDDEHRYATDPKNGELLFWAGNTAIHVFALPFVRRVASEADRLLPYHASAKKIPGIDAEGCPTEPSEPNGYKFERFVFDALPAAERVCVVEADRSLEYSPVKNAEGSDSPATARRDLIALYRRWIEAAGLEAPDGPIEIDHARIDGPEDLAELASGGLAGAGDAIVTAPGGSA
jgi:UDP-N-acetylglucosamine/UDP-N-acetylgalactosamine diphosphorylase